MQELHSSEVDQIAGALCEFQGNIDVVGASTDGHNYKYADFATIKRETKDALKASSLSITQIVTHSEAGEKILVTILLHTSGQFFKSYYGLTVDKQRSSIQGEGSGLSYIKRYMYCAILGIITGKEDDDGAQYTKEDLARQKALVEQHEKWKSYCSSVSDKIKQCGDEEELNGLFDDQQAKLSELNALYPKYRKILDQRKEEHAATFNQGSATSYDTIIKKIDSFTSAEELNNYITDEVSDVVNAIQVKNNDQYQEIRAKYQSKLETL